MTITRREYRRGRRYLTESLWSGDIRIDTFHPAPVVGEGPLPPATLQTSEHLPVSAVLLALQASDLVTDLRKVCESWYFGPQCDLHHQIGNQMRNDQFIRQTADTYQEPAWRR